MAALGFESRFSDPKTHAMSLHVAAQAWRVREMFWYFVHRDGVETTLLWMGLEHSCTSDWDLNPQSLT